MATTVQQLARAGMPQWDGFNIGLWQTEINIRDFIQQNYTPYYGDESFLEAATERTRQSTPARFNSKATNSCGVSSETMARSHAVSHR